MAGAKTLHQDLNVGPDYPYVDGESGALERGFDRQHLAGCARERAAIALTLDGGAGTVPFNLLPFVRVLLGPRGRFDDDLRTLLIVLANGGPIRVAAHLVLSGVLDYAELDELGHASLRYCQSDLARETEYYSVAKRDTHPAGWLSPRFFQPDRP